MPPRRKAIGISKESKGTISAEEIGKADDHLPNQDDPHGSDAAVKRQGRKVAISAKERGEAVSVDVPNPEVSIRSSKQKALHKILSMDKEDADDCTDTSAFKPSIGETENAFSGVKAGTKQTNKKKQARRGIKALKSIPEDVAMEANFVELSSKAVSEEVEREMEVCANQEKPDRGKRRSAHDNKNDRCKSRMQQEEEQQGNESQKGKTITCHQVSRKRGGLTKLAPGHSTTLSPIQAREDLLKKTTDDLSMPTEKPDSLTREPTKPEPKKDQTLNARSSTRTKKVVHYNEQSPESDLNEKKVSVTEPPARAATKRNTSAAKLPSHGAKRVKEDPTSISEETLGLDSARVTCVQRGRRHQKLSSSQNLVDGNAAAPVNSKGMGKRGECREHQEESNSQQVDSASAFNNVNLDEIFLLQTAQRENVKCSPAQEGAKLVSATGLEKASSVGSIMHGKTESDQSAHNQVSQSRSLSDKSQEIMMANVQTSLETLSMAAGKSVVQHSIQDLQLVSERKELIISKGRKVNAKGRTLPDVAPKAEGDLRDALQLESNDETKHKVFEARTLRNASAAKLLTRGATRVKKNSTSASEETLELDSAGVTCVKRGRRHQKLSSPQNLTDKKSVAFINDEGTEDDKEFRNSEQVDYSSEFINGAVFDKAFPLKTVQSESVKFSPTQEGAKLVSVTGLEKMNSTRSIMHGKRKFDHIAHNQTSQNRSLCDSFQAKLMTNEATCLEMLSLAASTCDEKKLNTSKGRKVNGKRRALLDTVQKVVGDQASQLESDEEAKPKVVIAPLVQAAANPMTDAEAKEMCATHQSIVADRKFHHESQNGGRNTLMRKRTVQATGRQIKLAKKQKNSELDTLPSPASLDMIIEGAAPAENQEHEKMMIQQVESQGWNAVDITNSESRLERSSEKKRWEETKRKRAMKFDALPVGFGLGISWCLTPPWANQSMEEEEVEIVDSLVVKSTSPMEEVKKQLCLQETAMPKDATNTSLDLKETFEVMDSSVMGAQVQLESSMKDTKKRPCLEEIATSKDATNTLLGVKDTYNVPPHLVTAKQASSFPLSDSERLLGSGIEHVPNQEEKAKMKRQAGRKTKTSKALPLESIPVVNMGSNNSILDKENFEPKLHVHNDQAEFKKIRSSKRRVPTAGKENTTRSKRN